MRQGRFTAEQIIKVLKEHAAGISASDLWRKHGRWAYQGLEPRTL
jgi:putative transposase